MAWIRTAIREAVADPQFSDAQMARIYRVYRLAMPVYAVLALATAASRHFFDPVMAWMWVVQSAVGAGVFVCLLLWPQRAHRVMQVGLGLLVFGMLARVPRAAHQTGLGQVDLHALVVALVIFQLLALTVFAPRSARRIGIATVVLTCVTAFVCTLQIPDLKWEYVAATVRLFMAAVVLVALVSFVHDTVAEHATLLESHRLMQTLAMCDSLTDLPNRRACEATLVREIARARRDKTPLSLVMIDVDHFKEINDQRGHDAGDRVLVEVAQTLRNSIRLSDEAARWAGDEFMIVLPATALDKALRVAERIRAAVECAQATPISPTVTLGVAELVASKDDMRSLVARADRNLYEAKRSGRNCTVAA